MPICQSRLINLIERIAGRNKRLPVDCVDRESVLTAEESALTERESTLTRDQANKDF